MPGSDPSAVEATETSSRGFRLRLDGRELFVPYAEFPWFRDVPAASLRNIERPQAEHLFWPDLDVDLSLASIEDPARYPLMARA